MPERALAAPAADLSQAASRTLPRGWIHSPTYDLAFFILSPLAGLALVWGTGHVPGGALLFPAAVYLVAIPHYLSTFSFFLGDQNLAYYRSRRAAFFLGPLIILAAVAGLHAVHFLAPILIVNFVWNVWHVAFQSAGIQSLYRRLNGGNPLEKWPAHLAILGTNAAMAFWHIDRHGPLHATLSAIHPMAPWALSGLALPIGLGAAGILAYRLRHRRLSGAEAGFLVSSLLLFHPYLWVEDLDLATLAMLMGHFIQYLAIVWLLNARKYGSEPGGSRRQRALHFVSARPTWVVAVILASGILVYGVNKVSQLLGIPSTYVIAWNALILIHFYLDGLVWAFRQPFVRQSIGAYLTPAERVAPTR